MAELVTPNLAQSLRQSYTDGDTSPWRVFLINDVGTITQTSSSYNIFGSGEFEQDVFDWLVDGNGFQLVDSQGSRLVGWMTQYDQEYNASSAWAELAPAPNVKVRLTIYVGGFANEQTVDIELDGRNGDWILLDPDGVRRRETEHINSPGGGLVVGQYTEVDRGDLVVGTYPEMGPAPPSLSELVGLRLDNWVIVEVVEDHAHPWDFSDDPSLWPVELDEDGNPLDPATHTHEDPDWLTPTTDVDPFGSGEDLIDDWLIANGVTDVNFAFYGILVIAGLIVLLMSVWRANRG